MELGTVVATVDGPSPSKFTFVVTENGCRMPVRQGQFVEIETEEGRVIAFVTGLIKTNRYFMRAESVKEYERGGRPLTAIFPADRWEYLIAEAQALGVQGENRLERTTFPPSPGQKVCEAEPEALMRFLGLNQDGGVELGKLRHHEVPVRLDLTKLLRKHVAVLAMSGAGKSHFASVVVEELLDRLPERGRVAVVVIDVHGEYVGLAESFSDRVSIVKGRELRIGVPNLSPWQFKEFVPDMSDVQARELQRVLSELQAEMRSGKGPFGLDEVIAHVERDERIHKQLQQALLGWLFNLRSLACYTPPDTPAGKA